MTIDCTDFRIQLKGAARKGNLFRSHKYTDKSALHYELRLAILMGNLVWVEGPFPAGAWKNDIHFFNSVLSYCLEPGERVEADKGHVGHANKIKCPNNDCKPVENFGMQSVVRSCHKTLDGHLENWGILEKVTATTSRCTGRFFTHVR